MSHTVSIKLQIKDLDAFEKACHHLGMAFLHGVTTCNWEPGAKRQCSHAIQYDCFNQYQLGLQQQPDGSYSLIQSAYLPTPMRNALGEESIKLQDAYAVQVAISQLQSEGYTVNTWVNEFGETVVEAIQ